MALNTTGSKISAFGQSPTTKRTPAPPQLQEIGGARQGREAALSQLSQQYTKGLAERRRRREAEEKERAETLIGSALAPR